MGTELLSSVSRLARATHSSFGGLEAVLPSSLSSL